MGHKRRKNDATRKPPEKIHTTPSSDKPGPFAEVRTPNPFHLICLILLPTIIYFNCLHNEFVFDDIHLILQNPSITSIKKIPSLLFSKKGMIPYRPLRWISYTIDYHFFGFNPLGYHITNITFHVLTSLLIYLTFFRLVKNLRIAFFAALLFAVHPVHTDSVTYISGRRDILSTFFYLVGFYLFLEYRNKTRLPLLALAFIAYLLAIASKEMAVTLPAIFFCYDFIRNLPDEGPLGKRIATSLKKISSHHYLLYLLSLMAAFAFTFYKVAIASPSNKEGFYGNSFYIQSLTVAKILVYYIKLLLFPVNLIADYSFNAFPLAKSLFEPDIMLSFLLLSVIGLLTLKLLSDNKLMAFSVIWFFVTLLPVCHIFPHHELLAAHYLYLPSFGFVLFWTMLLEHLLTSSQQKNLIYVSLILILTFFSLRTFYRNNDWKDSFTLWNKTVKTVPDCVRALNNLGVQYYKKKDFNQAEALFRKALSIQPVYEKAYYNLGNLYREKNLFNQALDMYSKAAQLNPGNFKAHNNLGNTYAMLKRYEEAINEYKRALKIKPLYAEAHNNLGNVYRTLGDSDRAIIHYQVALALNPRYVDAYRNLANTYGDIKQYDKAIGVLEEARRQKIIAPSIIFNLASIYSKAGTYEKAIELYHYAIANGFQVIDAHNNLASIYTTLNRIPQAVEHYQKVLESNPSLAEPYLSLGMLYLEKVGDSRKALPYLKKWITLASTDPRTESIRKIIDRLEKGERK